MVAVSVDHHCSKVEGGWKEKREKCAGVKKWDLLAGGREGGDGRERIKRVERGWQAQAPGSSYIWLSGKVSSNLSQIPNDFSLKSSIPDRVYHMTSKKGNFT